MSFDINKIKPNIEKLQYEKRIKFLKEDGKYTENIQRTVSATIDNIFKHKAKSLLLTL